MSGCREEWHAFYYPIREAQFWRTTKFHARSINNFPGAVGGSLMGRVLHFERIHVLHSYTASFKDRKISKVMMLGTWQ